MARRAQQRFPIKAKNSSPNRNTFSCQRKSSMCFKNVLGRLHMCNPMYSRCGSSRKTAHEM
eukprot:10148541-Prorocentrum_lima.AAC.1